MADRAQDGDHDGHRRRRLVIGTAAALAVVAVLATVSLVSGPSQPDRTPTGTPQATADPVAAARLSLPRRQADDPLALGRVDAPVVVVEWGDFQCPFCRVHALGAEQALIDEYVEDGRVRIEWHDFAYLGPESVLAARAARAAARQDRFWEFHGALYRDQSRENRGEVTAGSLTALAGSLGLDVARFGRALADPAIARAVADDQELGTRVGVGGVPSFVIGDRLIFGAQPLPAFREAIDAALARSR